VCGPDVRGRSGCNWAASHGTVRLAGKVGEGGGWSAGYEVLGGEGWGSQKGGFVVAC